MQARLFRGGAVFQTAILLVILSLASPIDARVTHVDIESRSDVLNGKTFGTAGAYEQVTGRVYFSVRIDNSHNAGIADLPRAVNRRHGAVEFSADFVAFRPKEANKGNGSIVLDVPNRGHSVIVPSVGDTWLLQMGYTVVSLGWQWDACCSLPSKWPHGLGPSVLRLYAPVARERDGSKITGLLRGDVMPSRVMADIPLEHLILGFIGGSEYPVAVPDDQRNTLTVRDSRDAQPTTIPRSQWRFAQVVNGKVVPSDRYIHLHGGFQPGKLYEYLYVATDPAVAGLGFAAVRDFASYAKSTPDAIVRGTRVYGIGVSQDGRFLRDFLYQGFNADEEGRIALDGVLAHVAGAGRGSFNYRFAQPSRTIESTAGVHVPCDLFPFTDLPEHDPTSGESGGLLDRAVAEKVVPKIFYSNTSYEYWGRAAALIHTSADGQRDVAISPNVRIYHLTGLQHFPGPFPPSKGEDDLLGQQPESPLPHQFFWRAMISNMDAWVRSGTLPPASSYPRIDSGTLVPLSKYSFPAIPGVDRPREANEAYRLDFGPDWRAGTLSVQPPRVLGTFPVLVPQVDADGNERDGVRLPEITVPLGTYTGWNLRDPSIGASEQRVYLEGAYIPFPKTAVERRRTGDPRLSIAERYSSREEYLARYTQELDGLIRRRWILRDDRPALILRAQEEWSVAVSQH